MLATLCISSTADGLFLTRCQPASFPEIMCRGHCSTGFIRAPGSPWCPVPCQAVPLAACGMALLPSTSTAEVSLIRPDPPQPSPFSLVQVSPVGNLSPCCPERISAGHKQGQHEFWGCCDAMQAWSCNTDLVFWILEVQRPSISSQVSLEALWKDPHLLHPLVPVLVTPRCGDRLTVSISAHVLTWCPLCISVSSFPLT